MSHETEAIDETAGEPPLSVAFVRPGWLLDTDANGTIPDIANISRVIDKRAAQPGRRRARE